jgi:hypothetical protein
MRHTDTKDESDWWQTKKLGSLIRDTEDIHNRKCLASIAIVKYKHLLYSKDLTLTTKLRIYNAYIKPILTYNCGTWG